MSKHLRNKLKSWIELIWLLRCVPTLGDPAVKAVVVTQGSSTLYPSPKGRRWVYSKLSPVTALQKNLEIQVAPVTRFGASPRTFARFIILMT
jgi:hypothetical protein